jgi:hypothetical protein
MNFVQRILIARQAARMQQRVDAQPSGIRLRRWLLMLLMIGMIIEGAIQFIKFYF